MIALGWQFSAPRFQVKHSILLIDGKRLGEKRRLANLFSHPHAIVRHYFVTKHRKNIFRTFYIFEFSRAGHPTAIYMPSFHSLWSSGKARHPLV